MFEHSTGPRLDRSAAAGRRGGAVLLLAGLLAALAGATTAAADTSPTAKPTPAPPPSSIGDRPVFWMAVSPVYQHTGLVAAQVSGGTGCSPVCLWVSHNGGASWFQSAARNWNGGRFVITADKAGHDVMYSGSGNNLQVSLDEGESWSNVGTAGTPTAANDYASSGTVAVAGSPDYLLRNGKSTTVSGSGGTYKDISFMLAPGFPNSGSNPPALLSAGDPKNGLPVIQQCNAQLACQGSTSLPGAVTFSLPVTLVPSNGYAQDSVVFAQSGHGIYKSVDAGKSFAPLTLGLAGASATATPMLALAPGYNESGPVRTAYAAVLQSFINQKDPQKSHASGGVYRTTDGGATWSTYGAPSSLDDGTTAVAVAPDGRVFGAYLSQGHQGLLCNADGTHWVASCPAVGDNRSPQPVAGANGSHAGGSNAGCTGTACPSASAAAATGSAAPNSGSGGASGGNGPNTTLTTAHTPTASPGKALAIGALIAAVVLAVAAGVVGMVRRRRAKPVAD